MLSFQKLTSHSSAFFKRYFLYFSLGLFPLICIYAGYCAGLKAAPKALIIDLYGDSTTVGATTINGKLGVSAPRQERILEEKLSRILQREVVVRNYGVGGSQAHQLLNGTDGRNPPFGEVVAQSNAQVVSFNYALNDTYYCKKPTEGYEQVCHDYYRQIMTELVNIAKRNGKIVVLNTPNPTKWQPSPGSIIYDYTEIIKQVAIETDVGLVDHFYEIMATDGWQDLISADKVHPMPELYQQKASRLAIAVVQAVNSQ